MLAIRAVLSIFLTFLVLFLVSPTTQNHHHHKDDAHCDLVDKDCGPNKQGICSKIQCNCNADPRNPNSRGCTPETMASCSLPVYIDGHRDLLFRCWPSNGTESSTNFWSPPPQPTSSSNPLDMVQYDCGLTPCQEDGNCTKVDQYATCNLDQKLCQIMDNASTVFNVTKLKVCWRYLNSFQLGCTQDWHCYDNALNDDGDPSQVCSAWQCWCEEGSVWDPKLAKCIWHVCAKDSDCVPKGANGTASDFNLECNQTRSICQCQPNSTLIGAYCVHTLSRLAWWVYLLIALLALVLLCMIMHVLNQDDHRSGSGYDHAEASTSNTNLQSKSQLKSWAKLESKSTLKSGSKSQAKARSNSKLQARSPAKNSKSQAKARSSSMIQTKSQVKARSSSMIQTKSQAKARSSSKIQTKSQAKSRSSSKIQIKSQAKIRSSSKIQTKSRVKTSRIQTNSRTGSKASVSPKVK